MTQATKAYVNQRINIITDRRLKKNFKVGIWLIIISVLLTAVATYFITDHFREKFAEISAVYNVTNESIIFTLHNDAKVSASEIRFIGMVNGEEKPIKVIRDRILSNKEDIVVSVPIKMIPSSTSFNFTIYGRGDSSVRLHAGKDFKESYLIYRIECDKCRNKPDEWRLIRPLGVSYELTLREINNQMYVPEARYLRPEWVMS